MDKLLTTLYLCIACDVGYAAKRSVLPSFSPVLDSEDDYLTGCQNVGHCQQNSSVQDYVHLDDQTQPTLKNKLITFIFM